MSTMSAAAAAAGIKSEPGKAPVGQPGQPGQPQPGMPQPAGQPGPAPGQQSAPQQQPAQMMLGPQGMTYINPQQAGQMAAGQQVAFQGGQIIVRAAAPQDGSQVVIAGASTFFINFPLYSLRNYYCIFQFSFLLFR